jgi:hypothetical protein
MIKLERYAYSCTCTAAEMENPAKIDSPAPAGDNIFILDKLIKKINIAIDRAIESIKKFMSCFSNKEAQKALIEEKITPKEKVESTPEEKEEEGNRIFAELQPLPELKPLPELIKIALKEKIEEKKKENVNEEIEKLKIALKEKIEEKKKENANENIKEFISFSPNKEAQKALIEEKITLKEEIEEQQEEGAKPNKESPFICSFVSIKAKPNKETVKETDLSTLKGEGVKLTPEEEKKEGDRIFTKLVMLEPLPEPL